jgi:hypothetical protein
METMLFGIIYRAKQAIGGHHTNSAAGRIAFTNVYIRTPASYYCSNLNDHYCRIYNRRGLVYLAF